MSNSTTKSVAVLCDEARLLAASKLQAIVNACAEKAFDEKAPSVTHAKLVLEIVQLEAAAVEKKSNPAPEKTESGETEESEEKSFSEKLLETLNELRLDPVK